MTTPPYPTLQLALSEKNPDHVKIIEYLKALDDKRHGYRSRLVEKALLMWIAHHQIRGEESPQFWTPVKGRENETIILDPARKRPDPEDSALP